MASMSLRQTRRLCGHHAGDVPPQRHCPHAGDPARAGEGGDPDTEAAIAGIFTTASGAGPTMADDRTALFHADHGNLATVAFSAPEWAAARKRIFSQTVPGTGSTN